MCSTMLKYFGNEDLQIARFWIVKCSYGQGRIDHDKFRNRLQIDLIRKTFFY